MLNKKFKYKELLNQFPNCPSSDYEEVNQAAFRWVDRNRNENNFLPMHLIKTPPPRFLDDNDKMCKGYGLSLFNSFENALTTYEKRYLKTIEHLKLDFKKDFGEYIASFQLTFLDGAAGDLNTKSGHFTFHEYENIDLSSKINNYFNIFDNNGNFIN